jgi:hypothetical protein
VRNHIWRCERTTIQCVINHSRYCGDDPVSITDGRTRPKERKLETDMWGFLNSPVGWTTIILILSSLGIFREFF